MTDKQSLDILEAQASNLTKNVGTMKKIQSLAVEKVRKTDMVMRSIVPMAISASLVGFEVYSYYRASNAGFKKKSYILLVSSIIQSIGLIMQIAMFIWFATMKYVDKKINYITLTAIPWLVLFAQGASLVMRMIIRNRLKDAEQWDQFSNLGLKDELDSIIDLSLDERSKDLSVVNGFVDRDYEFMLHAKDRALAYGY